MLTPAPVSRRTILTSILVLLALASLPSSASAQYFGRNKVKWEDFDWKVLKTDHFDVYHYPEEERAIRDASRMAERWYGRLSSVFEREFRERKSIILYADHSDFQQTYVVGGLISQGVGGVTEGMKTRVVLPLTGNYEETDHVLGHELVHVFQYDILREPRGQGGQAAGEAPVDVPLWFIEGLAEYLSLGRESVQTSMWLRDALARDAVPTIQDLSRDPRLFPYRWGHALWAYIGGRWGDLAVGRLFTRGVRIGFEGAVAEVLGTDVKTLSEDWRNAIRQTYAPVLERRLPPTSVGTRILPREQDSTDLYIAPVVSPDGSQVAFLSTRNLFTFDLYLADARTGEIRSKLLSEDSDSHFDSLRFLDSSGTWSPDGRRFAFIVLARGDNEIAVLDVGKRKVERRYNADGVGGMWNPSWSPDGRSIVFSGSAGGITDLYLLDLESGRVRRLTDDLYADLQPEWALDGKSIVFVSDRGAGPADPTTLTRTSMGIWRIDLASSRVSEVVPAEGTIERGNRFNPKFGPGGRDLYFLSDGAGVTDLYRMAMDSGEIFRVTRLTTGVTGIARLSPALTVSETNGRVLFTIFDNTDYRIHALEPGQARGEPVIAEAARGEEARAAQLPPLGAGPQDLVESYLGNPDPLPQLQPEVTRYKRRLQLDAIGPAVGVGVSTLGTTIGGDITAYFSDTLGEHEVGFSIYGGSGTLDEFGGQGYYLNQEHRLHWGAAGGHIPYVSLFTTVREGIVDVNGTPTSVLIYDQVRQTTTQDQALAITSFPFSTTRRIEAAAGVTRLDYKNEVEQFIVLDNRVIDNDTDDLPSPPGLQLYQGSIALVGDNSYFGFTSPVRGHRYRFEVEPTFGDLTFQSLTLDYRRYFFARPVTFAIRGMHLGRYGTDAESNRLAPLYVGYPTLVRGYESGDFSPSECSPNSSSACPEYDRLNGSRIGVLNLELRFPLVGTQGFGLFQTRFLPVELGAFVDAGAAWTENTKPELRFDENTLDRVPVVSAGLSARLLLGGFAVLHFYAAKPFQRPRENWVTGFFISPGW